MQQDQEGPRPAYRSGRGEMHEVSAGPSGREHRTFRRACHGKGRGQCLPGDGAKAAPEGSA